MFDMTGVTGSAPGNFAQLAAAYRARHGVSPSDYHLLSDLGVRKRYRTDFDPAEADRVLDRIVAGLATSGQLAAGG